MPSSKTKQNRANKTLTSRREEISEESTTSGNKQLQLASTANKDTEAPVPGWPARPWQPTMHRWCDGGEAPHEETSHRVTRRRKELIRASIHLHVLTGLASRIIAQTRPQVWLLLVDVDNLDRPSWPLSNRVINHVNLPHDLKRAGVFSLPLRGPAHKPTWGKYID